MSKRKKSAFIINFEYFWVSLFVWLVRAVPLWFAYSLSRMIAQFIFVVDRKHRNRTIQHMLHAGIVKDRKEALALARKNFRSFGRMAVDTFRLNAEINAENIDQYVTVIGSDEAVEQIFKEGTSIIALSLHLGNFVFIATAYSMISGNRMLSVIRPYDNPKLEEIIKGIQCRAGSELCHQQGALKSLLGFLRRKGSVGLVVDQHPGRKMGVETSFFGHPALAHTAPALLHLKLGAPLCPAALVQSKEDGKFEFIIKDPIVVKPTEDHEADIRKVAQLYTTAIEELVRDYPEQWFWAHRRWLDINRKGYPQYKTGA